MTGSTTDTVLGIATLDNRVSYWQEKHDFLPSPVPLPPFPITHGSNCEWTEENFNLFSYGTVGFHNKYLHLTQVRYCTCLTQEESAFSVRLNPPRGSPASPSAPHYTQLQDSRHEGTALCRNHNQCCGSGSSGSVIGLLMIRIQSRLRILTIYKSFKELKKNQKSSIFYNF